MKFSFTKNPESDFYKESKFNKTRASEQGSHISPASATAFRKQTFTPNFYVNAININYSKFVTFITGE